MQSYAIRTLVSCALGAAVLAGCASPSSSSKVAAAQSNVQTGKIVAIEPGVAVSSPSGMTSSGSGASGTASSGTAASILTIAFADGTQTRYGVAQGGRQNYAVGAPVRVVKDRDNVVILSP